MDKEEIRDKIEDLCNLRHRAEMKHINADRMGDRYLRKEGNELDIRFEDELEAFAQELAKLIRHK